MIDLYKNRRTGSLVCLLVRKCLWVSISRGKPSIYFLLNIGYPLRRVPSCPVVVLLLLCPSVRPVIRPVVVVRPLSVRPLSVRPRPSVRRRPSSVRPSRRPSIYYLQDVPSQMTTSTVTARRKGDPQHTVTRKFNPFTS